MKRYFIEISYNGTKFFGWQRQPKQISVQEEIETTLSKIHSNKLISVIGCGRTDAGVHAKQYFFHVDLEEPGEIDQFIFKMNRMLPESIVVHSVQEVDPDKHARFNATSRTYRYYIHRKKNAFTNGLSWHVPSFLHYYEMNAAAKLLIGTQDFTSFSKLHTDVKTNVCTVSKAEWIQISDDEWYFEITADRFLRNMVRAIVGSLLEIGLGKIEPFEMEKILEAKNRGAAFSSVPACGLFLWEVTY